MELTTSDNCTLKFGIPTPKNGYLKTVIIPEKLKKAIPAFKNYSKITMHNAVIDRFLNACNTIVDNGLSKLLTEYGGSFCIRNNVNDRTKYSIHSWGLAFDINMSTNKNNTVPQLDARIVAIFKYNGFDWGGDFVHTKDGMHFQVSKKVFNLI